MDARATSSVLYPERSEGSPVEQRCRSNEAKSRRHRRCFAPLSIDLRSWRQSGVNRQPALLPIGETILINVNIIELNSPQLLREHVRVFAVATRAVDDDRQILISRVAPLGVEFVDFLVDIGFPH